jgi:site-specific DNA-cytosine methylase
MGWPDDWTRWADDGAEIADSPRYRMCGNGVVAPVAEWIGRRIMEADQ